jgi:AraC-like DNA-binding protein
MSRHYGETPPPPHLAPYIEAFWHSSSDSPVDRLPIHPDGCMDILANLAGELTLIGAMPRTEFFSSPGPITITGIRFHPGMLPSLLPIDAAEWTGGRCPLPAFDLERITPKPLSPVQKALAFLRHHHGNVDLDWLADQSALSTRQFRRHSLRLTGLSPKHLARILRLRLALQLHEGHPKWAWTRIAQDAGYFDQAHLIRDHRDLTGFTPTAMSDLSNETPTAPVRL